MKKARFITLVIIIFTLFGGLSIPAHAKDNDTNVGAGIEWDILTEEVVALYQAGEYGRALEIAQKAFEVAEENVGKNHSDMATSLNNLGFLYKQQSNYTQAEPLYKRALSIREKAHGPNHPDVAMSLNNLADLYRATDRNKEAEALEQRVAQMVTAKR